MREVNELFGREVGVLKLADQPRAEQKVGLLKATLDDVITVGHGLRVSVKPRLEPPSPFGQPPRLWASVKRRVKRASD